jgi:hypothetical protein
LALLAGCGDNATLAPDAGPPPDTNFGEFPHGAPPQVESLGGPVLTAPKIVPIFFTGDGTTQAQVEQFLAMLPGSSYWHDTTSEYGVGDVAIQPTIVTTDTPPTTDTALEAWIASNLDGTHAGWTFDPSAIYSVFLPSGVVLQTQFGKSCQAFGGYHSEIAGQLGRHIVYALLPRCQGGLSSLTSASSHEFIEAATDPLPFSNGAYQLIDDEHAIWNIIAPGAEVGDMCEFTASAFQPLLGSFEIQRTWSNASALAGHDPCVPLLAMPFEGAAPIFTDDITIPDGMGGTVTTKGVTVPTGMSKTIDVKVFSDAPTADYVIRALDANVVLGMQAELTFSLDKASAKNGDTLKLTITRTRAASMGASEFLVIAGPPQGSTSIWFGAAN